MKIKELLTSFLVVVVLLPCILIVNESDTFVPNIIGLAYIILLMLFSKTSLGQKTIKHIDNLLEKF